MKIRQEIYLKLMGGFCALVAVFCLIMAYAPLQGCATLTQHSAAVELIVSQATLRYIESAPQATRGVRAAKIIAIADQVSQIASGEPVTIADLAHLALEAIPAALTESDRALAVSVISIAAQELQNKIGENVLTADQQVSVKQVIDAIRNAARIYSP